MAWTMTAEELLERYAAGQRDFSRVNLSGCNLTGADLSGCNLTGADLTGADLSGCNLTGADLTCSKLRGVKLIGCKFNGTNLLEVEWRTTDLTNVNLTGAVNFYSGLLENVLACNTIMPDGNIIDKRIYWEA